MRKSRKSTAEAQLDEARRKAQDLRERLRYLGDDVPLSVRPGWMAAVWSDWVAAKSMFVPALNNQDGVDGVSNKVCAVLLGMRTRDEPEEVKRYVVCYCVLGVCLRFLFSAFSFS